MLSNEEVLKYAPDPNDPLGLTTIKIEARLLLQLGPHPRIIEFYGLTEEGLLLKYYPHGDLHRYLTIHPHVSLEQRLLWCKQIVEAVEYVHSRRVIHCDITLSNILLDERYDIVLADFQGVMVGPSGNALIDGLSREPPKSFMPRDHSVANIRTDLFAVGSAIYHIIVGHDVFPELCSCADAEEIGNRFKFEIFPPNNYILGHIVEKCWRGQYSCAVEISAELAEVQALLEAIEDS